MLALAIKRYLPSNRCCVNCNLDVNICSLYATTATHVNIHVYFWSYRKQIRLTVATPPVRRFSKTLSLAERSTRLLSIVGRLKIIQCVHELIPNRLHPRAFESVTRTLFSQDEHHCSVIIKTFLCENEWWKGFVKCPVR